MATNKKAIDLLVDYGWIPAKVTEIVEVLVDGGLLEADVVPEESTPERYARVAKEWVGTVSPRDAFRFASGWSTASWEYVLKTEFGDTFSLNHNIQGLQDVFAATVLLAKEAGIEL